MDGFHITDLALSPGCAVLPGNWGRIVLGRGSNHDWYEMEMLYERIRSNHYSDKPSRLNTAFLFPNQEHALHYWVNHAQDRRIYMVEKVLKAAPEHHTFMTCMPPVTGKTDEEIAHHYWRADYPVYRGKFAIANEEIFTTSPLRILFEFVPTPEMFEDPSVVRPRS